MPDFALDARITPSGTIICQLTANDPATLENPVLCFSLLAPVRMVKGGELINSLGGFCEVRLEGLLSQDHPISFEIAYADPGLRASNRAWQPLNPYLKRDDGAIFQVEWDNRGVIPPTHTPQPPAPDLLRLVPQPSRWSPTGGCLNAPGFRISGPPVALDAFDTVNRLAGRNGFGDFLSGNGVQVIGRTDPHLDTVAYRLELTPETIGIAAADRQGFFHGAISLLTLQTNHAGAIPAGTIEDQPRFPWRGQHLDCARHYYQPETILRLLDLMALMKLNVFHWHFADDEAFRLEVDCWPELWQKTAFRGEDQTIPGVFGGGSGPTGGSYGAKAVDTILARAKELQIDVLPEVEIPAHSLAVARVFPELRDPSDVGTETSVQGYQQNALNPAMPGTYDFLHTLCQEIGHRFPFAHVHLGGDELPPDCWRDSPAVDQLKAQEGLKSSADVMGFFLSRLAGDLRVQGIRPCAWQEAAEGRSQRTPWDEPDGIGHGALLFSWTGAEPGQKAAAKGYDVVMCPAQHLYFDMAQTDSPNDWGATWAAIVGLTDTVNWEPLPGDDPAVNRHIIGIQGAYWSEFTTDDRQMEPMLAPRILGLSCMAWSPRGGVSTDQITDLARVYGPTFDALNWTWSPIGL